MSDPICDVSWSEWPVKDWPECVTLKIDELAVAIPIWFNSLVTGEATIGSYGLAIVIVLSICLVFAEIEEWLQEHPRIRRGLLLNLVPAGIAIGLISYANRGETEFVRVHAFAIAIYYGILAFILGCHYLISILRSKREESAAGDIDDAEYSEHERLR